MEQTPLEKQQLPVLQYCKIMHEVEQNVIGNMNNTDMYPSLLANMQSQQITIQDSIYPNSSPKPSWNDAQVHISTASGTVNLEIFA